MIKMHYVNFGLLSVLVWKGQLRSYVKWRKLEHHDSLFDALEVLYGLKIRVHIKKIAVK